MSELEYFLSVENIEILLLYFTWQPVFFDSHLFSIYVVVTLLSFFACVCGNLILISPAGVFQSS